MDPKNRRSFLKFAALAGSSAVLRELTPIAFSETSGAALVKVWRTSGQRCFQPMDAVAWRTGVPTSPVSIHLDPDQQYQHVLGFGAALTDAACYVLEQLDAARRKNVLEDIYGPSGLRFSVSRTTVGSSDYSLNAYNYDDTPEPDPDLTHFSIGHDRKYILPLLREARQVNPELFYFSSPWSPPGWMKANGSMFGGSMLERYLDAYARYFLKFLQGYEVEGVKINAVTVQNETDTDQGGRMPQTLWAQECEIHFVKSYLGPLLRQSSSDTKIWILDHNYDLWGRAMDELSDPEVYKYVDGVAWHGYAGVPSAMTRVHDSFPAKNAYWTEGGPDYTDPNYSTDWTKWSSTFTGILRNWARCIVCWNLALDERGRPDIGPYQCGGLITVNSQTHGVTYSGQYRAFAHYSKFIQRGARIFESWGDLADIDHVAAENPDGSLVLVLTNRGGGQQVQCTLRDQSLTIMLPPDSITTLAW